MRSAQLCRAAMPECDCHEMDAGMTSKKDLIAELLVAKGFEVAAIHEEQPKEPRFVQPPAALAPKVREHALRLAPDGLYEHQAIGLGHVLSGEDVCLATRTASGKSLVFQLAAAHALSVDPSSTVLALYPARALVQDQLKKWNAVLAAVDERAAIVDGSIPVASREEKLRSHRVILMTPDVAHAWLLGRIGEESLRFITSLSILVLDEAHVYNGVFGTNMAYFLRRLSAVCRVPRLITSTATLGDPAAFVEALTGRRPLVIANDQDGSGFPGRAMILARPREADTLEHAAALVAGLAECAGVDRFLAFTNSRKLAERLPEIALRRSDASADEKRSDAGASRRAVLPYRAGYEERDRQEIQEALSRGGLKGVVATSALELGIDIGDIDVAVLFGLPQTMMSFWQRIGRAGRSTYGVAILVDDTGVVERGTEGLKIYLGREIENPRLYLDNKYIQYAQALCAAAERTAMAGHQGYDDKAFDTLPEIFRRMLANEIDPIEPVPDDLYWLKQRAQAGFPHLEFPMRAGPERSFRVRGEQGPVGREMGSITHAQMLREAYPGALYYYMGDPYRVLGVNFKALEIKVRRDHPGSTRPNLQCRVFPKVRGGIHWLRRSDHGFIGEFDAQVSERVLGFKEQRGSAESSHEYGLGSQYSQRPVARFFETSGIFWYFDDLLSPADLLADVIYRTYCGLYGIHEQDIGCGIFVCNAPEIWPQKCAGAAVYDNVIGGFRLTRELGQNFEEVATMAAKALESAGEEALARSLYALAERAAETRPVSLTGDVREEETVGLDEDWVRVIEEGSKAIYVPEDKEVTVLSSTFGPSGLMYKLESEKPDVEWLVDRREIRPIYGVTKEILLEPLIYSSLAA